MTSNFHKIIFGDSIEQMNLLEKESIDIVLVDPPYNTAHKNTKVLKGRKDLSSDFGEWDYFEDKEYLEHTQEWMKSAIRNLKNSGNFLTFCKLEYVSDFRRIALAEIDDGAEVIIAGGGLFSAILSREGVREVDGAPVLDPFGISLKVCEMMVDLSRTAVPIVSRKRLYYAPQPREVSAGQEFFFTVRE